MKKITIEDLKKAYRVAEKENEARAKDIESLEKEKAELNEKARQSAIASDQKAFDEYKRKAEFIGYRLEALKETQEAKKNITLPMEEVKEAWANEEKARREKLNDKIEELERAKDKLKAIFNEIIELENDGLKKRNTCGELVGIDPFYGYANQLTLPKNYHELAAAFPMKYFYTEGVRNPETVYYLQREKRYQDLNSVNSIISKLFNTHSAINTNELNIIKNTNK